MAIARHKTRRRELREARALLRRVQRGDLRAFELLYAAYEGRLYRFCHRLTGDDATAAALVELTFARALADLPDAGLDTLDVAAYLHSTARALAYERTGDQLALYDDAANEVGAANERLAPQERAALALRDLEGRPDAELAGALGVHEAEVPGLIGEARLHLHAELRPLGDVAACRGKLADLSAYSDGTLPAERRAELEQHVAGCADCRAALFALQEAALRYRSLPVPEPPGDLGSRITSALGSVGLPARKSAAAESVAAEPGTNGGRKTAAAVAMGALAIVGVGVTIAAAGHHHDGGKPAPAPASPGSQAEASRVAPPAGSSLAIGAISLNSVRRRPPPALHHLRTGARRHAPVGLRRRPPPNPVIAGLGKSYAPESPPVAVNPPAPPAPAVKTPRPERKIPVQIVPPVAPSHAQAASDGAAPPPQPPPAPEPPPPAQTTTT
ncbi:MAG TPA: zf-HC2 domain-containing protein [Gaiellales bacterium]|jgi:DNA-directed RNA polymerase specialized sigma24 family protein|nr:zf-HC2 domain-containing protein [Gaiellales bacterium]